jgi:hypothetical protein
MFEVLSVEVLDKLIFVWRSRFGSDFDFAPPRVEAGQSWGTVALMAVTLESSPRFGSFLPMPSSFFQILQ